MKKYLLWILILWSSAAGGETLLVLGDSIGASYGVPTGKGWVSLLERKLRPHGWKVVNASQTGATTTAGLARIDSLLRAHKPDLTIVELGGNDGLRGIATGAVAGNLHRLIQRAQDADSQVLLIGVTLPPNYGRRRKRDFEQMFARVGREKGVPFVSFAHTRVGTSPAYLQIDRIHPNRKAQPILTEAVWDVLAEYLELE